MKYFKIFLLFIALCFGIFYSNAAKEYSDASTVKYLVSADTKKTLQNKHNSIDNAKTIRRNIDYETTISSGGFHYYCLTSQEKEEDIIIEISSKNSFSLSFQLFDSNGTFCSPSSYTFDPVNHILQIYYPMKSQKNYLFGLQNTAKSSATYIIHYGQESTSDKKAPEVSSEKKNTSTKSKTKNKTTSKSKPTAKPTTKPITKPTTTSKTVSKPQITSKPKSTVKSTTATSKQSKKSSKQKKKKQTISYQSLKLSHTFLQIKSGDTFRLQASLSPSKSSSFQWSVSDSSLVKKRSLKNQTFSATASKKGTFIVTCRVKGNKKVSACCTVKVQ